MPSSTEHRVVAVHRGRVLLDDGRLLPVRRRLATAPLVGDLVRAGDGAVEEILPRRTLIARGDGARGGEAMVANADLALVVTSLNRDLNLRRIERLLALALGSGLDVAVTLTKSDLSADPAAALEAVAAVSGGAPVLVTSAHDGTGLAGLHALLAPGRIAVMLGSSGSGKSTLANVLLGEERMATRSIRERDDRGRHATTHRELLELPGGALLVDTPGLRVVPLADSGGLAGAFSDLAELGRGCRFRDCRHAGEPGCEVRAAIDGGELDPERLAAYRRLEREAARADRAAERARERAAGRAHRRVSHRRR